MVNDKTTESEIRATLERVLKSPEFARSKRMQAFLRFVVEETLADRGDRLKAFSIAVEVYGRDETFNSRTDAIVRVQAGRLRSRLEQYYARTGRNDPVRLELPKGGYKPIFSLNENSSSSLIKNKAVPRVRQFTTISIWAVAILMLAIFGGWLLSSKPQPLVLTVADKPVASPSPESVPFLAVLPFTTISDDLNENHLSSGLVEALITDLAKISGLSVMAHASLLSISTQSIDASSIRQNFGATHILRGSLIPQEDIVSVNVQLIDTSTHTTIWAEHLIGTTDELLSLTENLAKQIAEQLAVQVNEEEHRRIARQHTKNPEALVLYRQALVLLIPPNEMERVLTARNMFRRIIEIDPEFAGGYAGAGFSHTITVLFLKATNPTEELEKGISLAMEAIDKDPEFGMGYVSLALAYALSGRGQEALFNARKAISVQPGDAFTQFTYGISLILSGDPQGSVAALSRAIQLDPVEPRTPYRNVLGIAHYIMEEYSEAIRIFEENISNGGPRGPHMDAFRASTYAELGKHKKAKSIIDELVASHPDFPIENWLHKWLRNDAHFSQIMENLYRLGLPISSLRK